MRVRGLVLFALFVGLVVAIVLPVAQASAGRAAVPSLRAGIVWERQAVWRWQAVSFARRSRSAGTERHARSVPYLRWVAKLWHRRLVGARRRATHPPHLADWLCIQSGIKDGRWSARLDYLGGGYRVGWGEGGWRLVDGPYFGGLQMDLDFQGTYGNRLLSAKGTADHWSPFEQMWVGERAVASGRGFYPWPTTARDCGLI